MDLSEREPVKTPHDSTSTPASMSEPSSFLSPRLRAVFLHLGAHTLKGFADPFEVVATQSKQHAPETPDKSEHDQPSRLSDWRKCPGGRHAARPSATCSAR